MFPSGDFIAQMAAIVSVSHTEARSWELHLGLSGDWHSSVDPSPDASWGAYYQESGIWNKDGT